MVSFRSKQIQSEAEEEFQTQEPVTESNQKQESTNIDINQKLEKALEDSAASKLSDFIKIDEPENESDSKQDLRTAEEKEDVPLSDLQKDVIINLELISELVEQVHQLDILAKNVDKIKTREHENGEEIDDEEYYLYDNEIEDIDEENSRKVDRGRPSNNRIKNIGLKIRPDRE